jgi:antirestriction protein ArdC
MKAVGASVRKDEKGAMVVYWQPVEPATTQNPESVLRYYFVYNISQIDHLPEVLNIPCPPTSINQLCVCDEIIERMPNCPTIKHGKRQVQYDQVKDTISLPKQGSFTSVESYYYALFKALMHSTGHQSRLNRSEIEEPHKCGSDRQDIETLIIEIGACYLLSVAGIVNKDFDNTADGTKRWIDALRGDNRLIVYASEQAHSATNYILNVLPYRSNGVQLELGVETH